MFSSTDPSEGIQPKQPRSPQFYNRTGRKVREGELVVLDLDMRVADNWSVGTKNAKSAWQVVVEPAEGDERHGSWLIALEDVEAEGRGKFALWGTRLSVELAEPAERSGQRIWAPAGGHLATLVPSPGAKCLGRTQGSGPRPGCVFNGWETPWGYAPEAAPVVEREPCAVDAFA